MQTTLVGSLALPRLCLAIFLSLMLCTGLCLGHSVIALPLSRAPVFDILYPETYSVTVFTLTGSPVERRRSILPFCLTKFPESRAGEKGVLLAHLCRSCSTRATGSQELKGAVAQHLTSEPESQEHMHASTRAPSSLLPARDREQSCPPLRCASPHKLMSSKGSTIGKPEAMPPR